MARREPGATAIVKASRAAKVLAGYPWIAAADIVEVVGRVSAGDVVAVSTPEGRSLGIASYNPHGRIGLRILDPEVQTIDVDFFVRRFREAEARRRVSETNSWRVAFAEADGLPGLIVDRYDQWLVVQVRSLGMDSLRDLWLPALIEVEKPLGILERSDMEGREEEGLDRRVEVLHGEVPDRIEVVESALRFICPTQTGLKTGFYLDQRDCRRKLAGLVRRGDRVLDVCCYSGGFALYATSSGARAVGVDILPEAVALARENAALNRLEAEFIEANAFDWLEANRDEYDFILLDPPAIAKTGAERESLRTAVFRLCDLAIPRLRRGGGLAVFSCSFQMSAESLTDTVRSAANHHGRRLLVDDIALQPSDHPYLAQFPESLYLKGLWGRVE